jgi:hypothetical protein
MSDSDVSYVLPRQALSYLALNKENFLSAEVLMVMFLKLSILHFVNMSISFIFRILIV